MIKKEIKTFFKSKIQIITFAVTILLMLFDVYLVLNLNQPLKEYLGGGEFNGKGIYHPAKASFLSGKSRGHVPQIILTYFMPLFVLLMCSDNYVLEHGRKYSQIMMTHVGKKKYVLHKYISSFIIGAGWFAVGIAVNFLGAFVLFKGGENFSLSLNFFDEIASEKEIFIYTHPYFIYFLYCINAVLIAGICSVFCRSVSFLAKNYKYTYFISFAAWMVLVISPFSITNLFQPFTEYGLKYILIGYAELILLTVVVTVIACRRMIKEDEL